MVDVFFTELSSYRKSLETQVKDRTNKLMAALEKEKELVEIRNRFVAIASHEFRVPLRSIKASLEVMKANTTTELVGAYCEKIAVSVERMMETLNSILEIGKAEKLKSKQQTLDIIEYLKELIEEVSAAVNHSHRFVLNTAHDVLNINSDKRLLRNVFINILNMRSSSPPIDAKCLFLLIETAIAL